MNWKRSSTAIVKDTLSYGTCHWFRTIQRHQSPVIGAGGQVNSALPNPPVSIENVWKCTVPPMPVTSDAKLQACHRPTIPNSIGTRTQQPDICGPPNAVPSRASPPTTTPSGQRSRTCRFLNWIYNILI